MTKQAAPARQGGVGLASKVALIHRTHFTLQPRPGEAPCWSAWLVSAGDRPAARHRTASYGRALPEAHSSLAPAAILTGKVGPPMGRRCHCRRRFAPLRL